MREFVDVPEISYLGLSLQSNSFVRAYPFRVFRKVIRGRYSKRFSKIYTIVRPETPNEFLEEHEDFIYDDDFGHYHLIHVIKKLYAGRTQLHDYFGIVDEGELRAFVLWTRDGIYVYGRNWNDDILPILSERVTERMTEGVRFCGESDLIKAVFEFAGVEFEVFKNRSIEECLQVSPPIGHFVGEMAQAGVDDSDEVIQMELDYNREEFQGGGSRTDEQVADTARQGINNGTIFTWRVQGRIVSMVSVINGDQVQPMLGSLYTKPGDRGNGYAYFILYTLTEWLLRQGALRCGLVADEDNTVTATIFLKVGYNSICRWCSLSQNNEV